MPPKRSTKARSGQENKGNANSGNANGATKRSRKAASNAASEGNARKTRKAEGASKNASSSAAAAAATAADAASHVSEASGAEGAALSTYVALTPERNALTPNACATMRGGAPQAPGFAPILQVLALNRFITDADYHQVIGIEEPVVYDAYEVTLR